MATKSVPTQRDSAGFLLGLARRYGPGLFELGRLGLARIHAMTVQGGRVVAVYDFANPAKFSASPLSRERACLHTDAP